MSSYKDHQLYQAIMYASVGVGTKGIAIVLCAFFDSLSTDKQQELLASIQAMAVEEGARND